MNWLKMNWFDRLMFYVFVNIFRVVMWFIFNVLYKTEQINRHRVPKTGGCFLVSSHSSYFDGHFFIGAIWYRMFRAVAEERIFTPFIRGLFLLKWLGAFPIKMGVPDRKAWHVAVDLVRNGGCVILFPEGKLSPNGKLQPGMPGAGMLAYMAKAPVVPVYIHGMYDIWPGGKRLPGLFLWWPFRRRRVVVAYGEPVDFSEYFRAKGGKDLYQRITDEIMRGIAAQREVVLEKLAAEKRTEATLSH